MLLNLPLVPWNGCFDYFFFQFHTFFFTLFFSREELTILHVTVTGSPLNVCFWKNKNILQVLRAKYHSFKTIRLFYTYLFLGLEKKYIKITNMNLFLKSYRNYSTTQLTDFLWTVAYAVAVSLWWPMKCDWRWKSKDQSRQRQNQRQKSILS